MLARLAGGSGTESTFDDVNDPGAVQRLVGDHRARDGVGGGTATGDSLPGTPAQWAAVRDEMVALRRAIERNGF